MSYSPNDKIGLRLLYRHPFRTSDDPGSAYVYICVEGVLEAPKPPFDTGQFVLVVVPLDERIPPLPLAAGPVQEIEILANLSQPIGRFRSDPLPKSWYEEEFLPIYTREMGDIEVDPGGGELDKFVKNRHPDYNKNQL